MSTETVGYIGLGSNLNDPIEQVNKAVKTLSSLPNISVLKCSPWYRSYAVGPGPQPDFINGAVKISTTLSAEQLLQQLQQIENNANRQRVIRWGPRTLDLDILLFGEQCLNSEQLIIPHPQLHERDFVILPLLKIIDHEKLCDGSSLSASAVSVGLQKNGNTSKCWQLAPVTKKTSGSIK